MFNNSLKDLSDFLLMAPAIVFVVPRYLQALPFCMVTFVASLSVTRTFYKFSNLNAYDVTAQAES